MRLTIVNSTAPGTASLLAPFFAAWSAERPTSRGASEATHAL